MTNNPERSKAVRSTVDSIRNIESTHGITKQALEKIKQQLIQLAANTDWFTESEFPAPDEFSSDNSCVYRLSQDEPDNRFALYVQSAKAPTHTPPHNHDTWAVITGIRGDELNRLYKRTENGVEQIGEHTVRLGTAVTLLPDELHSIHIDDKDTVINFHMYGLALECLTEREYYNRKKGAWKIYRSTTAIIDASYVTQ